MQPFREVECERLTQRNVEVATELDDRSSVLHTNREEKNEILTIGQSHRSSHCTVRLVNGQNHLRSTIHYESASTM